VDAAAVVCGQAQIAKPTGLPLWLEPDAAQPAAGLAAPLLERQAEAAAVLLDGDIAPAPRQPLAGVPRVTEAPLTGRLADELAFSHVEPLPAAQRARAEAKLGWDLGSVRVHTGDAATRSALIRGAAGYTLGNHVVVGGPGARPPSVPASRLLGHELAHVVQQAGGVASGVQRQPVELDPQAVADRMTLEELEAAVLDLRQEVTQTQQSSPEQFHRLQRLQEFERELVRRQQGRLALGREVERHRERVATTAAGWEEPVAGLVLTALDIRVEADALFLAGVVTGYSSVVPPGAWMDFLREMQTHPEVFRNSYLLGVPVGLWHGIANLVEGLWDLAVLGFWLSPMGQTIRTGQDLAALVADPEAYQAERQRELERLLAIRNAVLDFAAEFEADPTVILHWSSEIGVAAGEEVGRLATTEFLRKSLADKGFLVGDIVGQVVWEVLLAILLAVATAGVGNAIRAAGGVGQGARAGGRLAMAVRRAMEASPAVRRLVEGVVKAQAGARTAGEPMKAAQLAGRGAGELAEKGAEAGRAARALEAGGSVETRGVEAARLAREGTSAERAAQAGAEAPASAGAARAGSTEALPPTAVPARAESLPSSPPATAQRAAPPLPAEQRAPRTPRAKPGPPERRLSRTEERGQAILEEFGERPGTMEESLSELRGSGAALREAEVWTPPAGAPPKPPPSASMAVKRAWMKQRLQMHVDQAVRRVSEEAGLSVNQIDALLRNPRRLERAYRGTRIDSFAKATVEADLELAEVITAPMKVGEPDFLVSTLPDWFDATTKGEWAEHLRRYGKRYGLEHRGADIAHLLHAD
jgi:hypothetical protein